MKKILLLTAILSATLWLPGTVQALGPQGGDIYVSNLNGGHIDVFRFTVAPTGFVMTIPNRINPAALAFDGSGNLFVAEQTMPGRITKLTAPNISTQFATGLSVPNGLAFDRAGNLFEVDEGSNTIFKFAPDGTQTVFASSLASPVSLAFDSAGNLYVGEQVGTDIVKFTPDRTKTLFASGFNDPAGLAFDSSGNLFVSENVSGTIFKLTPDGLTRTPFVAGLNGPQGIAFDDAGNLVVAEYSGKRILRFNPSGTLVTATGVADLGPYAVAVEPAPHQLHNISTRGLVGTGDNVLIGGFIVHGNATVSSPVLVRALGPTIGRPPFNVPGVLQDPTLQIVDSHGTTIASNDNWKSNQQAQIEATGLPPGDDREAAIIVTLQGGAYTAIVAGANDTTGVALVEVYNLQN